MYCDGGYITLWIHQKPHNYSLSMVNYMACKVYFIKAIKNCQGLFLDKSINNFQDKRL